MGEGKTTGKEMNNCMSLVHESFSGDPSCDLEWLQSYFTILFSIIQVKQQLQYIMGIKGCLCAICSIELCYALTQNTRYGSFGSPLDATRITMLRYLTQPPLFNCSPRYKTYLQNSELGGFVQDVK